MKAPVDHPEEAARIAALEALDHLDTPAERRFDIITEAARNLFEVPIALVSLVDTDRQWFKSAQGIAAPETSREISFCGHAILQDGIFEIPDASQHPDFHDNPLVTGPPHIRFYAGVPASAENGLPLGTLCIIDSKPRELGELERERLRAMAHWLETELQNKELSGEELVRLVTAGRGRREGWLDVHTKTWNQEAGLLLLGSMLERAHMENQQITLGAVRLELQDTRWDEVGNEEFVHGLRLELANLMRSDFSAGVTFFSEIPDYLFFMSSRLGRLDRLPDLENMSRILRRSLLRDGIRQQVSLHASVSDLDARSRSNIAEILRSLCDTTRQADPGEVRRITI